MFAKVLNVPLIIFSDFYDLLVKVSFILNQWCILFKVFLLLTHLNPVLHLM